MAFNPDGFKNQKTIVGLAVMMIPFITTKLGYVIEPETVADLSAMWIENIGAGLALYGLIMKGYRATVSAFTKK